MPHVRSDSDVGSPVVSPRPTTPVLLIVGMLGFVAASAQLALLRELLCVFAGNELTCGIALALWLLLTATGTWMGALGRSPRDAARQLARGVAFAALLPIAQVAALRGARPTVFATGVTPDPIATIAACAVVLMPFCVASGVMLTRACRSLSRGPGPAAVAEVYTADAAGSIAGGVVFTLLLAPRLDHLAILAWNAALALGLAAWVGWWRRSAAQLAGCSAAAALVLLTAGTGAADEWTTARQYRGRVVTRATSPYGRLVVTERTGQLTFFENGVPVSYSANASVVEESAHFALAQRPAARAVLLVGGAATGLGREVLRYPAIQRVVCIEIDPQIAAAAQRHFPEYFRDPRLSIAVADGRRYLDTTAERFDAIIVALPDPTTFQLNRFYTHEFYRSVKRVLTPGGVLLFGISRYENYVSAELRQILSTSRATVATAFAQVLFVPASRVFVLASDEALTREIGPRLEAASIAPTWVTPSFLDATLTADRLAAVARSSREPAAPNADFRPVLYLLRLRQWLTQFVFPMTTLALLIVGSGLWYFLSLRRTPRLIFAGGFSAATLEVSLLVAFQVHYGALYLQLGLVVTAFMSGLLAGAAIGRHVEGRAHAPALRWLALALAALAVCCGGIPPHLPGLNRALHAGWPGAVVLILLAVALGVCAGAQFCVAALASPNEPRAAPRLFSADLLGATLGAVLVSTFLLPWGGLGMVAAASAGLNLLAIGLAFGHRS